MLWGGTEKLGLGRKSRLTFSISVVLLITTISSPPSIYSVVSLLIRNLIVFPYYFYYILTSTSKTMDFSPAKHLMHPLKRRLKPLTLQHLEISDIILNSVLYMPSPLKHRESLGRFPGNDPIDTKCCLNDRTECGCVVLSPL